MPFMPSIRFSCCILSKKLGWTIIFWKRNIFRTGLFIARAVWGVFSNPLDTHGTSAQGGVMALCCGYLGATTTDSIETCILSAWGKSTPRRGFTLKCSNWLGGKEQRRLIDSSAVLHATFGALPSVPGHCPWRLTRPFAERLLCETFRRGTQVDQHCQVDSEKDEDASVWLSSRDALWGCKTVSWVAGTDIRCEQLDQCTECVAYSALQHRTHPQAHSWATHRRQQTSCIGCQHRRSTFWIHTGGWP